MREMIYPDEVQTPRQKIEYVMAVYGIKEEDSELLKSVIKDISVLLFKESPFGFIQDYYDEFLDQEISPEGQ